MKLKFKIKNVSAVTETDEGRTAETFLRPVSNVEFCMHRMQFKIQTMHNEEAYLIIYCLNCIRCMQNSTFETGLILNCTETWLKGTIYDNAIIIPKYKLM